MEFEVGDVVTIVGYDSFRFDEPLRVSSHQVYGSGVVYLDGPGVFEGGDQIWRFPDEITKLPTLSKKCNDCGVEAGYDLVDVRVIVRDGEEGYDDVRLWFCESDLSSILTVLMSIGFMSHRHGGTNSLEDTSCMGYTDRSKCPTPPSDDEW